VHGAGKKHGEIVDLIAGRLQGRIAAETQRNGENARDASAFSPFLRVSA
jgi:hypothetical protein